MSLRKIRTFPDPILRKKCRTVKAIDLSVKSLADDMIETMDYAGGIGLAANQVGVLKRVVTLHLPEEDHRILVNPEIQGSSGVREVREGCLSFPGYQGLLTRSVTVEARWIDRNGSYFKISAEDLLAQAIEHEIDHLNGILFVDHLVAHQHLTRPVTENSLESHNHDLDVTVNVKNNDTDERLKTRVELNKVYSDSSLSELKYDLYDAGYLLDRE